jgi:pSer/pThr/pTyr-binding forkhead associated (FHA) protein
VWLDKGGVSRRHARIVVSETGALLEDLGSKNGTMLRGTVCVESCALCDGDTIRLGPVTILYRASDAGISTETAIAIPPATRT